mmetsp:Transcript_35613/g.78273  ORF Transcript_35613/g.78273 Transcript_35613/m.78273 type:complete len:206 (+) Transcript_35613:676-1293(+)
MPTPSPPSPTSSPPPSPRSTLSAQHRDRGPPPAEIGAINPVSCSRVSSKARRDRNVRATAAARSSLGGSQPVPAREGLRTHASKPGPVAADSTESIESKAFMSRRSSSAPQPAAAIAAASIFAIVAIVFVFLCARFSSFADIATTESAPTPLRCSAPSQQHRIHHRNSPPKIACTNAAPLPHKRRRTRLCAASPPSQLVASPSAL